VLRRLLRPLKHRLLHPLQHRLLRPPWRRPPHPLEHQLMHRQPHPQGHQPQRQPRYLQSPQQLVRPPHRQCLQQPVPQRTPLCSRRQCRLHCQPSRQLPLQPRHQQWHRPPQSRSAVWATATGAQRTDSVQATPTVIRILPAAEVTFTLIAAASTAAAVAPSTLRHRTDATIPTRGCWRARYAHSVKASVATFPRCVRRSVAA
jgi:hypothetical protein